MGRAGNVRCCAWWGGSEGTGVPSSPSYNEASFFPTNGSVVVVSKSFLLTIISLVMISEGQIQEMLVENQL